MTQWQPIETAPKDGRKLLLCAIKNGEYQHFPETYYRDRGEWFFEVDGAASQGELTHWMELPSPPKGIE